MTDPVAEAVAAALAEQQEQHEREIRQLEAKYQAMLSHLRTSFSYELGDMLVSLRGKKGRRAFPGRAKRLYRRIRTRKTPHVLWSPSAPDDAPRALSIFDEFTQACFSPELQLRPATKGDLGQQLDAVDLVFAETAWRGNGGAWSYAFSRYGETPDLGNLLAAARAHAVPTVLWNKEDPVNYDVFLPVAREFDHVFTTDAAIVDRYVEALGHRRVHALPFAAQPVLHNPIGRVSGASRSVCFAGAWRGHKYPERVASLTQLLEAAAQVGDLVIYDREPAPSERGGFADQFAPYVKGTLPYEQMVKAYRQHAVFLNTNSVTESPTMLSRRVFELLACRTPVVSTPSAALEHLFPDVVPTPADASAARDVIGALLDDVDHRDRVGQRGYRLVHREHTYAHRTRQILRAVGMEADEPRPPSIDAILVTNRPEFLASALDNIRRQDHPSVRLVLVTNADGFEPADVQRLTAGFPDAVVLSMPPAATLGECLEEALQHCSGEYFAKFDDDDWYGPAYLSDLLLPFSYTDASIVGKRAMYAYLEDEDRTVLRYEGHEFEWTSYVMGGTLLVRRADVRGLRFRALPSGTDTAYLKDCTEAGLKVFAADRFNYLMHRRVDVTSHTWQISQRDFLADCRPVGAARRIDVVGV
ncbi:MAG: glycosyltransferase family protein [Ilumatobacteraceae bacterium]